MIRDRFAPTLPLKTLAAGLALSLLAMQATAQDGKPAAGKATAGQAAPAWVVGTAETPKECWFSGAPQKSVAKKDGKAADVVRGDILLVASWRDGKPAEISFSGGYPFKEGSEATLILDGKRHKMITEGKWAWLKEAGSDEAVLSEMRAGKQMVITGTSARGTVTEDFFSMKGVTAASDEARAICG